LANVLFIIENVPFSLDTRVQREARTLQKAGLSIVVICPRGDGECWHESLDGVVVYRYWKPSFGKGILSHVAEYLASMFGHTLLTALVALRHRFDVIHAANPPDILWMVAAPYKLLGKRFIYDQHDLVPELFEVRFGERFRLLTGGVRFFERMSYRLADHVISTNDTFRQRAMSRGGCKPQDVTVVRNGPHLSADFPDVLPNTDVRALARHIVGYLGIMNPQDHLDNFLEMARIIRYEYRREDIGFVMVGSGDSFDDLRQMRDALGLTQVVKMTGTIPWQQVLAVIAATDLCIQPDPPTAFNRHLTMNKLMEYMAMGKAVLAFDLPETRVSGGSFVEYVAGESPETLARAVIGLIDDPERRVMLGQGARHRIESELAWEHQERSLLGVYRQVLPGAGIAA